MWYYLVRYSFDPEKSVFGPFNTEEEAWKDALISARKEYDIDTNENGWDVDMTEYEDCGEIILVDHFDSGDESTEYLVFEI